jgi:hypothetical protein
MKANMDIEQWHHKWRMLPAQVPGTGAVIECVDCQHQLASYDSEKGFGHARGCTVAEGVPQFPWDDLRVALICSGVVLPPSAP